MINIEELSTTSLEKLINEIEYTNQLLDNIELLIDTSLLQPHERIELIKELQKQEMYYKILEQEVHNRGCLKEENIGRSYI